MDNELQPSTPHLKRSAPAIDHFQQAIASGRHWFIALLESIGLWTEAEEQHNGRHYRYLIDGEAFDWLLMAERLCEAVDSLLPEEEKNDLLFHGKPPISLTTEKFKGLIGQTKYQQYLNYFYGVTVEEAITWTVREEVRKEQRPLAGSSEHDIDSEVYQRIYGASKAALLRSFRQEKDYPQLDTTGLGELKEFTYWLFKYHLKHCDKAKVASDTKKALEWAHNPHGLFQRITTDEPNPDG
ncbi:MAG: hypothetical protein ABH839_02035 [Chloroflexota bacterium]